MSDPFRDELETSHKRYVVMTHWSLPSSAARGHYTGCDLPYDDDMTAMLEDGWEIGRICAVPPSSSSPFRPPSSPQRWRSYNVSVAAPAPTGVVVIWEKRISASEAKLDQERREGALQRKVRENETDRRLIAVLRHREARDKLAKSKPPDKAEAARQSWWRKMRAVGHSWF